MKKKQADISPDIEELLNEEFTEYMLSPIDYLYFIATKEERDDLDTYRDTMHETIDRLFKEGKTEEYRQLMDEYIKVFENKVDKIFSRHFNNIIENPDAIIKDAKELTVKYLKSIRSFCLFLLNRELPFKRAEARYYKEDNTVLIDYNMFYGQRENLFPYHYARMKDLNRAQELDQGIANAINESFCCNDPDDEEGILGFDFYTIFKKPETIQNKEIRFKKEETRITTVDSSFYNNVFNVKPLEKPLEFPIYVYENNKYGKPPERIPQLMTVAPDVEYYKEMGLPTLSEFSLQTLEDVCNMIIEKPENNGKIKFTISQLVTKSTGSTDTRDNIKLATAKYWELKQLSGIWIFDITTGIEKRLLSINFEHTGKTLLQTTVNVTEESPFLPIMKKLHHAFKDEILLPENKKKTYNNLVIIGFVKRRIITAQPGEPYYIYYEDLAKHLKGQIRKSRVMKDLSEILQHLKEIGIIESYARIDQRRKDGYMFTVKGERTKRLLKNPKN